MRMMQRRNSNLRRLGMGALPDGHMTGFRVYKAPDGTKGFVTYTSFDSTEAAKQMIEKWLNTTPSVTSREKNQTIADQLVSDRILGQAEKDGKKEFVIIGRDGLKCYLIESASLQVALQVEGKVKHR